MKAIKAGREFNLFDEHEAAHISLAETGSFVTVGGTVYPLMRGTTFEESQKVDALLDAKGGLSVLEHAAPTAAQKRQNGRSSDYSLESEANDMSSAMQSTCDKTHAPIKQADR